MTELALEPSVDSLPKLASRPDAVADLQAPQSIWTLHARLLGCSAVVLASRCIP